MKRFISVVLSVVLCLSLCACDGNNAETSSEEPLPLNPLFVTFLDGEGFVPGLSQGAFLDLIEKYSYNGEKVTDLAGGTYYDGIYGGGISGHCEFFGYRNDYFAEENSNFADYSNDFQTKVDLDGLTLPCGIAFGDTFIKVLDKLDIDIDPETDFDSDKAVHGVISVLKNERESLDCVYTPPDPYSSKPYLYKYSITFTENYPSSRSDGRKTEVTRTMTMSFDKTDSKLSLVRIFVNEKIERKA